MRTQWLTMGVVVVVGAGLACTAPPRTPKEVCETVECGKGRCAVDLQGLPACVCEAGFQASALSCVAIDGGEAPGLCLPNPCNGFRKTKCTAVDGQARCSCDDGHHDENGACVRDTPCSPNRCTAPNQSVCSVLGMQAVCSCNAGHAPVDGGCSAEPAWSCAWVHTGDGYETDECPANATQVEFDTPQSRTIEPAGDQDWVVFPARANRIYEVQVQSPQLAMYLDVYKSDAVTVLGFDHRGVTLARARFRGVGGNAWARIKGYSASTSGAYTLTVRDVGFDDFADTPGAAVDLTAGTPVAGQLDYGGDVDVFRLSPIAGHKYRYAINADGGSTGIVHMLQVLRGNSALRTAIDFTPQIVTRAATAEDLYVRVSAQSAPGTGPYVVSVSDQGADDCGDEQLDATQFIPNPALHGGTFEQLGDSDVYRVEAIAGHQYVASCASQWSCSITVRNASWGMIGNNFSGSPAVAGALATGPIFFVFASASGAAVPYQFRIDDLGADEHGNSAATATQAAPGISYTGRSQAYDDLDYFKFTPVPDHLYRATCTGTPGSGCGVRILNGSGAVLATAPVGTNASSALVEAPGVAPLFVEVRAGNNFGAWTLSIEDVGIDDAGDFISSATPAVLGGPMKNGELETPADVDVFSFSAVAGRSYRLIVQTPNVYVQTAILDGNGNSIAGGTTGANLTWAGFRAVGSGTLYARVSALQPVAYSWRVEELIDDHGNTLVEATPVPTLGLSAKPGVIEVPDDLDVFAFTATANDAYRLTLTTPTGSNAYLPGARVRTAMQPVASSAYFPPGILDFKSTANQTLYVELFAETLSSWGGGAYTWKLEKIGSDDHGDTAADATPLSPGATATGRTDFNFDADAFSFTTTANRIYRAILTPQGQFSAHLTARAPDGTQLGSAYAASQAAAASFKASVAGVHTFEVGNNGSPLMASYSLKIDELTDDHGDEAAEATLLSLGTPTFGVFEFFNDTDWFELNVTVAGSYQVSTTGAQVYSELFSATGGTVAARQVTPRTLGTLAPGKYFLKLSQFGTGAGYTVTVQ